MTAIVDDDDRLLGLYTDGDLRRSLDKNIDIHHTPIREVMTPAPRTTTADTLAASVVNMMEKHGINGLIVVDEQQRVIGAFNMHDVLRAGII